MKKIKFTKNPYLLFSPFLIVLIGVAIIFKTNGTFCDEGRYLSLAENILHGVRTTPANGITFIDGPGYAILLTPFIALRLPLVCITLMNAVFYYFSIVLLYKVLQQFISFKLTLLFSLFLACFINSYEYVSITYTETFSLFLITLIVFNLILAFNPYTNSNTKRYLFFSGFFIGYLTFTKPIFGYVLLLMLFGSFILWLFNRKLGNYRKGLIILIIGLITTAPYLIYTYSLTGRLFYWSSLGGNNLYWMSTPYEGEYGDWFPAVNFKSDSVSEPNHFPVNQKSLNSNHLKDFEEISKYRGVELDDVYKKIAIKNIKSNPLKFVQNCISNIGRILFNFPYSYKAQTPRTLLRLPFNGIILVLTLFCIIPTFLNWRKIPYSIRFMLFFASLYFCGSILGSAETRMFTIIVPVLLVWIAFIVQKSIRAKLKFDD
jgi:hypothetical protein